MLSLIIPRSPLANLYPITQLHLRLHYTAHTEEQRTDNKRLTSVSWEVSVAPTPTLLPWDGRRRNDTILPMAFPSISPQRRGNFIGMIFREDARLLQYTESRNTTASWITHSVNKLMDILMRVENGQRTTAIKDINLCVISVRNLITYNRSADLITD